MKVKALTTIVFLVALLIGCSEEISFESSNGFGVISTIKNDSIIDEIPEFNEVYIFDNLKSYKEYYQEFFVVNGEINVLDELDFEKNKIILYNTVYSGDEIGEVFHIEKVRIYDEKIKVYIALNGKVKADKGLSSQYYNHADIVKIDKNLMPKNYEIIIVRN